MKTIFKRLPLLIIALIFSCNNDDDNAEIKIETTKLMGTTWLNDSGNCHIYYTFGNDSFESINPCLENDVFDIVSYESGRYEIEENNLVLSISGSCNESLINTEMTTQFTVTETELTFIENGQQLVLRKTDQLPILPDDIEYGYFDFDNGGLWKPNPDCRP